MEKNTLSAFAASQCLWNNLEVGEIGGMKAKMSWDYLWISFIYAGRYPKSLGNPRSQLEFTSPNMDVKWPDQGGGDSIYH